MTIQSEHILVPLREQTVARLMGMRRSPAERLADIVERLVMPDDLDVGAESEPSPSRCPGWGRYTLRILGESRTVATLAEALKFALNTLADLDGGILERLEKTGGRTRRNVARSRDAIHPGREDLNRLHTLEFRPGWWTSTNYSYRDVCRIFKVLCNETGLQFGRDLEFQKHALNRTKPE